MKAFGMPGSPLLGIIASTLFVGLILGLLLLFDVDEQVLRLLHWIQAQGIWAPALFTLVMVLVVVLLLPGLPFTTGAGFVFGVVQGTVVVVLGTTLGAALAFLIARYGLGPRARAFLLRHARLKLVSEALACKGWKVVLLTRLVPFFPGKLSNYVFGLLPFSFRGFTAGTFLGIIPFSLHNVYLGAIAADLTALHAHALQRTPLQWAVYGLGFVVAVLAVVYLARVARRALDQYATEGASAEGDTPCPG